MVYCSCMIGTMMRVVPENLCNGGKMKIVCLFPGIGYTCDKPLLYYSGRMLSTSGWEVVRVNYGGFPPNVKGNAEKMKQCAEMALEQAEEILKDTDWKRYEEILFVSKSVGTVVAGAYAKKHGIPCRHVLFTPVEATFAFGIREAIAFHGTSDPWADSNRIREACRSANLPLYITEKANHSLETGDVDTDIETLKSVMRIVRKYAAEGGSKASPLSTK